MARVSDDHADESLCAEYVAMEAPQGKAQHPIARQISPEELKQHNESHPNSFWAVVDGFVVDASHFVNSHPGGLKKLMSTNSPAAGATGNPYGCSTLPFAFPPCAVRELTNQPLLLTDVVCCSQVLLLTRPQRSFPRHWQALSSRCQTIPQCSERHRTCAPAS